MSSPSTPGDPRSGRDRRVPTRTRAFKHGHIDPVTNHRRPLLTIGNILLLIVGVGFGMYATGNLTQLDAFFNHADQTGKAHNNAVVDTFITYGTVIFGVVLVALFSLIVFLLFNARRRKHVEGKGVANAPAERRSRVRRAADMPSLIMPLGKERPNSNATSANVPTPIIANTAIAQPIIPAKLDTAAPEPNAAKAEAIAVAAKAEAAIASTPVDPPSFVRAPKLTI